MSNKELKVKEVSHKIVISLPMEVYFRLKEKAGELTVKQYIELLLRNVAVREVTLGKVQV